MLSCPSCHAGLHRTTTPLGILYCCCGCGGRSVAVPVLRKDAGDEFVKQFLASVRTNGTAGHRRCAFCNRAMTQTDMPTPVGVVELDYCRSCNHIWFDPSEYAAVPPLLPEPGEGLSPKAREAIARYEISRNPEEDLEADTSGPDAVWQYLPALLGLPVEFNDTPMSRRPWLTWSLSLVMAALFTLLLLDGSLDGVNGQFGFKPAHFTRYGGLTILTSMFLHAGIWHIVANLYFFLIFGDNVEDHLGRGRFILLLLVSHVAGIVLHGLTDPRGNVPLVGASGAICGVLAYYAVLFPRAKLGFLFRYILIFRWIRISAVWALVLFVVLQLLGAALQWMGQTNVSAFGHLGGLAVGLAWGFYARKRAREPVDPRDQLQ